MVIQRRAWDSFRRPCGNLLEAIGGTPLVRLNRVAERVKPRIYAKIEWYSPSGSLKDRIYLNMVSMAEARGDLGIHPGSLISLAAILSDVAGEEAPHAEVTLPPGPLLVEGDARRLRLAVRNLVRNAMQFSDPGGPVRVQARVLHGEVLFDIEDEGRGLSTGDLERIFEAYVQVSDPDHRDHEGLGVGLTVARAILIQHGGRLWAESDGPGRGATFHARLPLASAAPGGDGAA